MDKLSDKIKFNAELSGNKFYKAACNDFLPGIEKLEQEMENLYDFLNRTDRDLIKKIEKLEANKEELIKIQIDYCFHECEYCKIDDTFNGEEDCKYCPFYQKNIVVLEKLTGKSWDQITKEQE